MAGKFGSIAIAVLGLGCALAGAAGGWVVAEWHGGDGVREYLLAHPEVLPEAMDALRRREEAAALAPLRGEAETPFPGAVLGNPNGTRTLVEFTDFACGYCRRSVADVDALVAAHPDLRVVIRQLPIISPDSPAAARMALAAARQGRFAAFHHALFAIGRPDAAGIAEAARQAGLDATRARRDLADPALDAAIERDVEIGRRLGIAGTPAWIAGNRVMSGALGAEALDRALAQAGPGRG